MIVALDMLASGRDDGIDWRSEHQMAAELAELSECRTTLTPPA
jgi:hypothetical protein